MANERTYPLLPCRELDESIAFYEVLGFKRTYRQLRPNPAAVVQYEDIHFHLFGMDGFDPADSYGSVIIVVPDPDALYAEFAAALRAAYGKLPVAGFPRILRPRKKFGTVTGFTVVDPGGNWLRIYRLNATQEDEETLEGLEHFVSVAARLGDARGSEADALRTLDNALARFPDAPALERVRAYLYRAELAVRTNNASLAEASLASVEELELTTQEQAEVLDELTHVTNLVNELKQ